MSRGNRARDSLPARGSGTRPHRRRRRLTFATVGVCATLLLVPGVARASQASSGKLLFYPCTSCHPLDPGRPASKKLPNGFSGHSVILTSHEVLGKGSAACLVCHDSPAKDPGRLKLVDGSLISITGDISRVCYRCHSDKHREFRAGMHGKREPKCTAAGCHDPHTPGSMYAGSVAPFIGSGFRLNVLPEREPFSPLAAPAGAPPVETPAWLQVMTVLGVVAIGGISGSLAFGRARR